VKRVLIRNVNVVLPEQVLANYSLLMEGKKIAALIPAAKGTRMQAEEILDGHGGYAIPGLIDLHIHGLRGLCMDSGIEHVEEICKALPEYGVTGVLATVLPRRKGEDAEYLGLLAQSRPEGAEILGFHLEGPFLALPGAVPARILGTADIERVERLMEAGYPRRVIFSVSPDFEGILDLIPVMAANGAPVFVTHTAATVEQTQAAINAGVRHATHFYDVFPSPPEMDLGVRPCGAVEVLLADPRVSLDFILDGEHVHPIAVKLALQCKGVDGVCLISDSNVGAGLPWGTRYKAMDHEVMHHYRGGPARICSEGPLCGGLAGSGLTLDLAVRNAITFLGVDLPTAVRLASTNPARITGLGDRKGRIAPGYDADLVLLDRDLNVSYTWVGGEACFRSEAQIEMGIDKR
jgi:N-acetylglucosamine-6-phosphate deacetylase